MSELILECKVESTHRPASGASYTAKQDQLFPGSKESAFCTSLEAEAISNSKSIHLYLYSKRTYYQKGKKSLGSTVPKDSLADPTGRNILPPRSPAFSTPDSKTTLGQRRRRPWTWRRHLLQAFPRAACGPLRLGHSLPANGECCFFTSNKHQHDTDIFYCYLLYKNDQFCKLLVFIVSLEPSYIFGNPKEKETPKPMNLQEKVPSSVLGSILMHNVPLPLPSTVTNTDTH